MKLSALGRPALAAASILLISLSTHAALVDRGAGLLYDDVLDITWLQDANYAKTSGYDSDGLMQTTDAQSWAADLVYYDSERDVFHQDWRLASNLSPGDRPFHYGWWIQGADETPTSGPHTELSYMFYENLGLIGYKNGGSCCEGWGIFSDGTFGGENDVGLVLNLQGGEYWSDSELLAYPWNRHWSFNTNSGNHHVGRTTNFSWAVADGDIAASPVPIPTTAWLFASGILGLIGFRQSQ